MEIQVAYARPGIGNPRPNLADYANSALDMAFCHVQTGNSISGLSGGKASVIMLDALRVSETLRASNIMEIQVAYARPGIGNPRLNLADYANSALGMAFCHVQTGNSISGLLGDRTSCDYVRRS